MRPWLRAECAKRVAAYQPLKTYTAINRDGKSIKVRARSNRKACERAAFIFGLRTEFRVFQSGYGFDSRWQKWASIYEK
jgi:hypothetical protein